MNSEEDLEKEKLEREIKLLKDKVAEGKLAEEKLKDIQKLAGELRAKRIDIERQGGGGYESRLTDETRYITIDGIIVRLPFNGYGKYTSSNKDEAHQYVVLRWLKDALFNDFIEIRVKHEDRK